MKRNTPSNPNTSKGLAKVLTALAGGPGVWRQQRRGSFLILVVGTLALLAVISILYVTIGSQDSRARAALEHREQVDDVPRKFADYVANQVIGPDTFSVWMDDSSHTDASGNVVLRRKTTTYPSIDWFARSNTERDDAAAFRVVPSADASGEIPRDLDRFIPTTPWLASTEPTFLNFDGVALSDASSTPPRSYLDNRDWAQISNFAPDGMFVNLVNLRNDFNASHEKMTGSGSGGQPPSLLDASGMPDRQTDFGVDANVNFPAFFTARQRGAFVTTSFNPAGANANDAAFPDNQWADADGDGMYDSRWFELADSRGVSGGAGSDLFGLNAGGYRYVFAARAIDLSALVNVNTASDTTSAPTGTAPWGISPADVDLRRLLTLFDVYDNFEDPTGTRPGGYDALLSPQDESNYGAISTPQTAYNKINAFYAGTGAYSALRLSIASGVSVPRVIYDSGQPLYLADFTPQDRSVNTGLFSLQVFPGVDPTADPAQDSDLINKLETWDFSVQNSGLTSSGLLGAERRLAMYRDAASEVDGVIKLGNQNFRARAGFGLDSLQELLTMRGLNNDRVTSPLEVALSGRNGADITTYPVMPNPGSLRFSPVRANRSFNDEYPRFTSINLSSGSDYDRVMLQFASDVRQRLTTLSGARQLRSVPVTDPRQMTESELKIDGATAAITGDVASLFQGYADALALDSDRGGAWAARSMLTQHSALDSLFYGGRGPEAALHIAAHMAINMASIGEGGTSPKVYSLVTNPNAAIAVSNADATRPIEEQTLDAGTYGYNAVTNAPGANTLSLPNARLAPAANNLNSAPITKIYGITPQPFITEVASFTVYYDAPPSAPYNGNNDDATPPAVTSEIDINGSTNSADCLYRVLAFQLTNPFDTPIRLSSGLVQGKLASAPTTDVDLTPYYNFNPNSAGGYDGSLDFDQDFYYIEYGGNYFKLASMSQPIFVTSALETTERQAGRPALGNNTLLGNYVDNSDSATLGKERVTLSNITIPAKGSVVLCSLSRDLPSRIYQTTKDIGTTVATRVTNNPNDIRSLVWRSIPGGGPQPVYFIPRVDKTDWKIQLNTATNTNDNTVFGAGSSTINLYRAVREGTDPNTGQPAGDARKNGPKPIPAGSVFWDGVTKPAPEPTTNNWWVRNNIANDQLVDRFTPPASFNIDRKLPPGDQKITGSDSTTDNQTEDGFTIAFFSSAVRPSTPPGDLPPGGIPAYCLEPKYVSGVSKVWNQTLNDTFSASPNQSDFVGSGSGAFVGAARSFEIFRGSTVSTTSKLAAVLQTAEDRSGGSLVDRVGDTANLRPNANIPETAATAYNANAPVIFSSVGGLKADRGNLPSSLAGASTVRLADMLLPLGVGPEFTPYKPGGTQPYDLTNRDEALVAWTTLSEALASAMGYDEANDYPTAIADSRFDPSFFFAPLASGTVAPANLRLIFDRVNLRTDDFVPFVDANADGLYSAGASEYRVGLELPLALNVMDQFTTIPATPEIDRATPGLININTAPLAVLRLVPGLSPLPFDPANPATNDPTNRRYWWRDPFTGFMAAPPAGIRTNSTPGSGVDIAATVAAYRDKAPVWRRPSSVLPSGAGFVTFADSGTTTDFPRVDYNSRSDYAQLAGRAEQNAIGWTRPATGAPTRDVGVSEVPGYGSVGEILGARAWGPNPANWTGTQNLPYNIDFMAYDGSAPAGLLNSAIGFETGAPTDPAAYTTYATRARPVSTREKTAIANVAFNSITTRSDYFAVWFMVHGYKKADVLVPDDNDPMIPSIRRRFLMVVDRSNVTKAGDKPRVVLFKELPVVETFPGDPNN